MKRWLRLGLQLFNLILFRLVLVWARPERQRQVAAGELVYILGSLLLLGFASMIAAARPQLKALSITGQELAARPRLYHLEIATHALELVAPRTLSTLGARSVGLGALGVSWRRAVWVMMPEKASVIAQRACVSISVLLSAGFSVLLLLASEGGHHA